MPGLHHGNLCWGNRKSFNIYGEYPTDILEQAVVPSSPPVYISTIGYYGYHKVNVPNEDDESMDISDADREVNSVQLPNGIVCRKRQSNEPNLDHVKRSRSHQASDPSDSLHQRDGRTNTSTYNLGSYML